MPASNVLTKMLTHIAEIESKYLGRLPDQREVIQQITDDFRRAIYTEINKITPS